MINMTPARVKSDHGQSRREPEEKPRQVKGKRAMRSGEGRETAGHGGSMRTASRSGELPRSIVGIGRGVPTSTTRVDILVFCKKTAEAC